MLFLYILFSICLLLFYIQFNLVWYEDAPALFNSCGSLETPFQFLLRSIHKEAMTMKCMLPHLVGGSSNLYPDLPIIETLALNLHDCIIYYVVNSLYCPTINDSI